VTLPAFGAAAFPIERCTFSSRMTVSWLGRRTSPAPIR
jgi:hypothetical protein